MAAVEKVSKVRNRKWSDEEFLAMRKEVLTQWPTGREIEDINEGVDYCKGLPWWKRFGERQERLRSEGKILLAAFVGRGNFEVQMEHLKMCEEYSPDAWVWIWDTYTRRNQYELTQRGIERSYVEGRPVLNGYPIVNYGLKRARQLHEATQASFWSDCSDEDPRLLAEMAQAGGCCAHVAQSFHEVMMHGKDYPLDKRIINGQYIDRLTGYYTEHGVPVESIVLGNCPGWDTPGFKVLVPLLHSLLAIEQGVRGLTFLASATMNLIQDVAALRAVKKLAKEYWARAGYPDLRQPYTVSISYQGAWPKDLDRAAGMMAWCAAIGMLGGADTIQVRAIDEAFNIATPERHIASFKIFKQLQIIAENQRLPESEELRIEQDMIEAEVRAVLDKILELGDGDAAVGTLKAVELGVLDTCFSPYRYVKNEVLTMRDHARAVRYFKHGNVPLPKEVIEYHQAKLNERRNTEGINIDMAEVIKGVTDIVKPITTPQKSA